MRYKKKPSKKKIKESHQIGAAGFFKEDGEGKGIKGIKPQPPPVRISSGLLDILENEGKLTIGYQYTEEDRRRWIDNRPTEVRVGSVDFDDDRIIKCALTDKPELKKGLITVKLKELKTDE